MKRNTLIRTTRALSLLALGAVTVPAAAADRALLDTLLANGTITQAQYDELVAKEQAERPPQASVTLDQNGFNIRSADGQFAMKVGARLHADLIEHTDDSRVAVAPNDGTELRRARIELSGTFHGDWRWAAESDFADNEVSIKDFWVSYRGFDAVDLTFGHQKQPYSLAVEMSSNDIPFTERSIDNDLIIPFIDRAIGVRADASGEHWYAAGGLYGESVDPGDASDEGWGLAARYVYAPIIEDDRVLHIGFRGAYREPADDVPSVRMRDETSHFSDLRIVDTGLLSGVDNVTLLGPEAAFAKGPFSIVGEYNDASISRVGLGNLDFSSWHVAVTWSLSGESRAAAYRIDAGEFKRLTPARNFSRGGGRGAWELAARYASIDLNDGGVTGGTEDAFTAAANWYVNQNVRMMFSWRRILDTDGSNATRAAAEGMNILAVRAQYTF